MAFDVTDYILLLDLAEIIDAARTHLAQKAANTRQVLGDGLRRQSSFLL